MGRYY